MHKLKQLWSRYCLGWNRLHSFISLKSYSDVIRSTLFSTYLMMFAFFTYILVSAVSIYINQRLHGWRDFRTIGDGFAAVILSMVIVVQLRSVIYLKRQRREQRKLEEMRKNMEEVPVHLWMRQRGVEPPVWSPALPELGIISPTVCIRGECPGTAIGEFWFNEAGQIQIQTYGQKPSASVQ